MPTDYSFLLDEYPKKISMDQLYRICHISKRKAKWLLENGYIPCKDTGRKTRRFTIQTKDVVSYLTLLETKPEALPPMPVGIFSSNANHQAKANPYLDIDSKKFTAFLQNEWNAVPDMVTVKEASKLIGYACSTITDRISKEQVKAILYHCRYLIPKDALTKYMAINGNYSICRKTEKHLKLIRKYRIK